MLKYYVVSPSKLLVMGTHKLGGALDYYTRIQGHITTPNEGDAHDFGSFVEAEKLAREWGWGVLVRFP